MTLGSILLATAVLILVGLFVFRPLLLPHVPRVAGPTKREQLNAEKEALLTEIKALDFDFETGKLPSAEYESERSERVQKAADILRTLDEMPEEVDSVEAQIEAAIASLRSKGQVAGGWVCDSCQTENPAENGFCGKCGTSSDGGSAE